MFYSWKGVDNVKIMRGNFQDILLTAQWLAHIKFSVFFCWLNPLTMVYCSEAWPLVFWQKVALQMGSSVSCTRTSSWGIIQTIILFLCLKLSWVENYLLFDFHTEKPAICGWNAKRAGVLSVCSGLFFSVVLKTIVALQLRVDLQGIASAVFILDELIGSVHLFFHLQFKI